MPANFKGRACWIFKSNYCWPFVIQLHYALPTFGSVLLSIETVPKAEHGVNYNRFLLYNDLSSVSTSTELSKFYFFTFHSKNIEL